MSTNNCLRWFLLGAVIMVNGCSEKSPTKPQTKNPVLWDVGYVKLQATDFYIEADTVRYLANVDSLSVGGDPGSSTYCTLELEWVENGTDMRLYIYFAADSANWWSDEVRTYDGAGDSDGTRWVYYYGEFFKSALGDTFAGNVDLTNDDSDNGVEGKLHFEDLSLSAF